jgi:ATP-binding cassette subfamily F protein 3
LVGKNGAGKTTLTRIFMGLENSGGELTIGHNVDIGYYAQNQAEELDGNLTVFETLDEVAVGEIRKRLRAILGSFLFSGEDVDKKVKVLSGGEKARLALCKLLLHPYNLLILDEPTNHLDIKAKEVLKGALKDFDGTLIVVSHDRDFLSGLTELVYEVTPKGLKQYIGDIKQFLHEKHATSIRAYESKKGETIAKNTASKPKETPSQHKESYQERKKRERDERKLKNQVKKYESRVQDKEQQLKEMDATMASMDPNDRQKLTEMAYQYEAVQQELNDAFEKWTEASERLESINN